jgi:hypothetical protein
MRATTCVALLSLVVQLAAGTPIVFSEQQLHMFYRRASITLECGQPRELTHVPIANCSLCKTCLNCSRLFCGRADAFANRFYSRVVLLGCWFCSLSLRSLTGSCLMLYGAMHVPIANCVSISWTIWRGTTALPCLISEFCAPQLFQKIFSSPCNVSVLGPLERSDGHFETRAKRKPNTYTS